MRIITSNLDDEFSKARVQKSYVVTGEEELLKRASRARVVRGSLAPSTTRVVEPFYSPFLERTTIELPTSYKDRVKWRRYFFENEPIVGAALELHAVFPLSTFWIAHEDSIIKQDFEDMCEELELFEFLLDMLLEYWICGECFTYGLFDDAEDPTTWTEFILLDPMKIDVKWEPLVRSKRKEIISLEPSDMLKTIVQNGPSHEETGELYQMLSQDIIDVVRKGQHLVLNNLQVSHIKRKGNYFNPRGTSIIDRCFKLLMYRDKLRSAQYAIADRHITPREFYFLGETGDPASQDEINDFRDLLAQQWSQPNQAIVYHHAVRVQWEGAAGRVLPLQPEFDYIDKQLFVALLINEGVLTAERQPYASTSVALDVMIQRYLNVRMRIQNWIENRVFKPICKIHKIYRRTENELKHRIRLSVDEERLWIPKVKWDKEDLRNDLNKIRLLVELADKGWIPRDMVLPYLNVDPETARKGIKEQKIRDAREGITPSSATGGGMMGMPGVIPEVPPEGEIGEEANLPEIPETPSQGYGEAVPPEAHEGEEGTLPTAI